MGAFADLFDVRKCGMLRLVKKSSRYQTFPNHKTSSHRICAAWGAVVVVLCASGIFGV